MLSDTAYVVHTRAGTLLFKAGNWMMPPDGEPGCLGGAVRTVSAGKWEAGSLWHCVMSHAFFYQLDQCHYWISVGSHAAPALPGSHSLLRVECVTERRPADSRPDSCKCLKYVWRECAKTEVCCSEVREKLYTLHRFAVYFANHCIIYLSIYEYISIFIV